MTSLYLLSNLWNSGFLPDLKFEGGTPSNPSISQDHKPLDQYYESTFKLLDAFSPTKLSLESPSTILSFAGRKGYVNWSGGEASIQKLVASVLTDVIGLAGLDDILDCCEEYGLKSIRADIWIIRKKGIPIGVVEIKRPHTDACESDIINNEKVLGQLYDYMKRLESFFGIVNVFGILTNYEDWRICWFANKSATFEHLPPKEEQIISRAEDFPTNSSMVGGKSEKSTASEIKSPLKTDKRTFYSTNEAINRKDPCLLKTLTSLILKMYHSPVKPVKLYDKERSYIELSETNWSWVGMSAQVERLDFNKFPNTNSKKFLLLADLRGGADGRVWLACSGSGKVCVIKFYNPTWKQADIERARDYWKDFWDRNARIVTLCNQAALLMPYVYIPDNPTKDQKDAALRAIIKLSSKGYFHNDLSWKHVGFYQTKNGDLVSNFIDLIRVEKCTDKKKSEDDMKKKLGL